jgi:hypothetical protein
MWPGMIPNFKKIIIIKQSIPVIFSEGAAWG